MLVVVVEDTPVVGHDGQIVVGGENVVNGHMTHNESSDAKSLVTVDIMNSTVSLGDSNSNQVSHGKKNDVVNVEQSVSSSVVVIDAIAPGEGEQ